MVLGIRYDGLQGFRLPSPHKCPGHSSLKRIVWSADFDAERFGDVFMKSPSIKGIAITALVDDVIAYRDRSPECQRKVETQVNTAGLEILEQKTEPFQWYPITGYQSLTQFLWETEGNRSIDYLRNRGAGSAERVLALGNYQQISFLRERYNPEDHAAFASELALVVSLQATFFNFTTWSVTQDPDHENRLQIEIRDAFDFPEELCHTTAGFVTRLGVEVRSGGLQWNPERPRRDLVVLRMDRASKMDNDGSATRALDPVKE